MNNGHPRLYGLSEILVRYAGAAVEDKRNARCLPEFFYPFNMKGRIVSGAHNAVNVADGRSDKVNSRFFRKTRDFFRFSHSLWSYLATFGNFIQNFRRRADIAELSLHQ